MADTDEIEDPKSAGEWLDLIADAERYFSDWQKRADNIDNLYSDLGRLANALRDRQLALFWSNIQVLLPAIYARPPIPVVTPKFNDRKPVDQVASEFLERNIISTFDRSDINDVMLQLRDDLAIVGRAVAWVRYEDEGEDECVHYEHVDRMDFIHEPARKWCDVGWVARRGWLTRKEMRKRFGADAANNASYQTRPTTNDDPLTGATDHREKCGVWEIWHKAMDRVVWVSEGVDRVLDDDEPHLKLEGFFPCPQPAYATVQRRTLIPVPDIVYYKDQLEEINDLTRRIHTLGKSLAMKGFYVSGGEIGQAVEAAFAAGEDSKIMIPVSGWAALGNSGDPVIWLPIEQVANTIVACVELRRQLISDVYEIVGLSDIMRGATQAEETLGAQQLKQQNGSYRVRDKQQQLVRVARDLSRIGGEIMAEEFDRSTLVDGAQMDLPTNADVKKQINDMERSAKEEVEGMPPPQDEAQMAEFAQAQEQIIAQWGERIAKAGKQVTIDQVLELLRNDKLRPYSLDIETDSTIYPDEAAEKAARVEFMGAFSSAMPVMAQAAALGPEAVALAGGVFKFALAPYRVGRELDGLIDDMVQAAPQIAERMAAQSQGGQDDMAALAEAEMEKAKAQMAKVEADSTLKQAELQQRQTQMMIDTQEKQAKFALENQKLEQKTAEMLMKVDEMQAKVDNIRADTLKKLTEAKVEVSAQNLDEFKSLAEIELRAKEQELAGRQQAMNESQSVLSNQRADRGEDRADRQQQFAERQPPKGQ